MTRPDRALTVEDLLDAVPLRNQAVDAEPDENSGGLRLTVPIRQRWFNQRPFTWFMPFRDERTFGLDALGREVWEACDGQTRIERIVERFAGRHQLSFHEARVNVMKFLRLLTANDLVVIVGREPESS